MARRRYHSRRYKRTPSMVWVPYSFTDEMALTENSYTRQDVNAFKPGMTSGETGKSEHFDQDVTLERIRGTCVHAGSGSASGNNALIPFWFAAVIAPALLLEKATGDELPDLRYNEDGDDYPLFLSYCCDVSSNNALGLDTQHTIDSKAKRKFGVGDAIKFFWGALAGNVGSTAKIHVALNVRLLFRLKI